MVGGCCWCMSCDGVGWGCYVVSNSGLDKLIIINFYLLFM